MMLLMHKGNQGEATDRLRAALRQELGEDATVYPSLQHTGEAIGEDMDAAIRRWQSGVGIIADGIVGPRCQLLLGLLAPDELKLDRIALDVATVSRVFPATKPANIARYLPYVEAALGALGLKQRLLVLAALGTIRAETEGFVPISETLSRFNTPPGSPPFSAHDNPSRHTEAGDGARFHGRGFVQLTGRSNYQLYGDKFGLPLLDNPDLANAPEVAAVLLAAFLQAHLDPLGRALAKGDLREARKLVNGGGHGHERFSDVFARADAVWPPNGPAAAPAPVGAGTGAGSTDTSPTSAQQRHSNTHKDAADLRDRQYMPHVLNMPDEFPVASEIAKFLTAYTRAGLILNQGTEGACTGFGLGCVINYLRWLKAELPAEMTSVSPRMLYTLARRHDEYQGEKYEGSSCRGALKGWFNHGVCLEPDWPYQPEKSNPAKYGYAERAAANTLGVYYRIDTRSITDMQAAIAQHRAVFVSAFTHDGWYDIAASDAVPSGHGDVPLIPFDGQPSQDGGHAFALVGFNARGFIIQNSWGTCWGKGGFAVLDYLDWLANAMDAWVVSLGVPGVIAGRLAMGRSSDKARAAAEPKKWWDSGRAYQHSVVLGNDGRVSRYLTADEPPRKLQHQACVLPDQWFRSQPEGPKRLVLYVHGGLNAEADAIKRVSAMGRFFIGNGCYPLFLVWKTGLLETISNIISDTFRREPARMGAAETLSEKTDLLIERAVGRTLGRPLWSEMKENAELAFHPRRGGDILLDALEPLASTWGTQFELHLIGHSAGSIAIGHLLSALAARRKATGHSALGSQLASVHLHAPACSVAFANRHYAIDDNIMRRLHLNVLSDKVERDDSVASIYRKSLLYLVSNALEPDLRTPILGLQRVASENDAGWDGSSCTGEALSRWRDAAAASGLHQRTTVIDSGRIAVARRKGNLIAQAATHASFDNNIELLGQTIAHITGRSLVMPVDDLQGF